MAGYSRAFWIGEPGGFAGADGMNPIFVEILVGEGNRQFWTCGWAQTPEFRLGHIETIVPEGPESPHALLDACLAFFAPPFSELPSFRAVESQLGNTTFLDFDLGGDDIPPSWGQLRTEARAAFENLYLMEGYFKPLKPIRPFG